MTLKVYYDLMSQPARALYIFLKMTKIPYTDFPVALRSGEHMTPDFAAINRFQKVPAIVDGDFKLSESGAIFQYLSAKYSVPDHWYPRDLQKKARVDEYMHWQHLNTRASAAMYFRTLIIDPVMSGKPADLKKAEMFKKNLKTTLDQIEKHFLSGNTYLCGNEISVADLLGVCELEQPMAAQLDVKEGRPLIKAWMERVQRETSPHYEDAHKFIWRLRDKRRQSKM